MRRGAAQDHGAARAGSSVRRFWPQVGPCQGLALPWRSMHHTARFAERYTLILVGLGAAVLATGCGSSDRLKKQVSQLESQITAMRGDQDRLEERLSALELAPPSSARASAPEADERVERPRLKVIHLGPETEQGGMEPADAPAPTGQSGSRPIIRGTGDRIIKVGDGETGSTSMLAPEPRTVALARNTNGD